MMHTQIWVGKRERRNNGSVLDEPQILVSVIVDGKPVSNLKASGDPFGWTVAKMAVRTGNILRKLGIKDDWYYVPAQRIRHSNGEVTPCRSLDIMDFSVFSRGVANTVIFGF